MFEEAYGRRALAFDARTMRADADVEPVPAHSTDEGGKSAKIVAPAAFEAKPEPALRKARLPDASLGDADEVRRRDTTPGISIAWALDAICAKVLSALEDAERSETLIEVRNPRCEGECLTDRWPENRRLSASISMIFGRSGPSLRN